ncbi:MAG: bacillithiol biosynthesis cysteine-adding enzyme BshC [Blastocatellia bacterium]
MRESACRDERGTIDKKIESLSFADIPGQSNLFIQYQKDPISLSKFYPSAVALHDELEKQLPNVLANYQTDRAALCDVLTEQNTHCNAGEKTFSHIGLLRKADTVAVVTGQQAGLFTGPLYTIYKALSAVKSVERLRGKGINAVPIFWVATEDHDFDEVSKTFGLSRSIELFEAKVEVDKNFVDHPVGSIVFNNSINEVIDDLCLQLPKTEFSSLVSEMLKDAWAPGSTFADGFGKMLAYLFRGHGLIIIDPLDNRLKQMASPIYKNAIENSAEIVRSLVARSEDIVSSGYQAQVLIDENYFPLFWHTNEGKRKSLKKIDDGVFRLSGEKAEFSLEQLAGFAESEPQRFSPGVMLRSVVQDYLLPTVCYFGGGAEIAYFAQNSEVYRILERPVTTILYRQSFTFVESKHARTLEKYRMNFNDLFSGIDALLPRIVEEFIDPTTPQLFAEAEEKINTELNRLDQALSAIDPTLAVNLATRRRKIMYHIGALRNKFRRVRLEKDETINRQINSAFTSLLPHGSLQERTLNIVTFLNLYGPYFIDWIYDSIDLDDRGHRVVHL